MDWTVSLDLAGQTLAVDELTHTERLDAVPRTEVVFDLWDEAPPIDAWLGETAAVTLDDTSETPPRRIAGVVMDVAGGRPRYEQGRRVIPVTLGLGPRWARRALGRDARIFRRASATAIAEEVLSGLDVAITTGASLAERIHTVQYGESDVVFLQRLLAEEGLHFAVPTRGERDVIAIFDAPLGPAEPPRLGVRLGAGMVAGPDEATALSLREEVRPGKISLRDADFERPRLGLHHEAEADEDTSLELYDFPGRFKDDGDARAQRRLEAARTGRRRVTATTGAIGLAVGHTVTLEGHPYAPLNGEVLIEEIRIEYVRADDRAATRFVGVPTADGPTRPALRPVACRIPGLQTAVVTGPAGEEISADGHGRVTTWFTWDRRQTKDETASLPIRTVQLPLGQSQLTPRIGWEVSMQFFEGDADAPLVTGRLMNAATPPPYPLPGNRTKSSLQTTTTPGGGTVNEIRFDDAAGAEELFMNASGNASVSAGNNATDGVAADEVRTISGDQGIEVLGGFTGTFEATQSIDVGGDHTTNAATKGIDEVGSHALDVGGSRSLTIGGDYKKTASGGSTCAIGGNSIDLVMGTHDTEAASISETIGAADLTLTATKSVTVSAAHDETAGAAKIIAAGGARTVSAASLEQTVSGAVGALVKGNRGESAGGDFTEVAGGAQVIQATNVTLSGDSLVSLVMGGSTLTLTPGLVAIAGATITLDGTVVESGPVLDL
ncbi:MAG: type VI secretion system tip protein TssI/VgrG [Myxococcota bacterium]